MKKWAKSGNEIPISRLIHSTLIYVEKNCFVIPTNSQISYISKAKIMQNFLIAKNYMMKLYAIIVWQRKNLQYPLSNSPHKSDLNQILANERIVSEFIRTMIKNENSNLKPIIKNSIDNYTLIPYSGPKDKVINRNILKNIPTEIKIKNENRNGKTKIKTIVHHTNYFDFYLDLSLFLATHTNLVLHHKTNKVITMKGNLRKIDSYLIVDKKIGMIDIEVGIHHFPFIRKIKIKWPQSIPYPQKDIAQQISALISHTNRTNSRFVSSAYNLIHHFYLVGQYVFFISKLNDYSADFHYTLAQARAPRKPHRSHVPRAARRAAAAKPADRRVLRLRGVRDVGAAPGEEREGRLLVRVALVHRRCRGRRAARALRAQREDVLHVPPLRLGVCAAVSHARWPRARMRNAQLQPRSDHYVRDLSAPLQHLPGLVLPRCRQRQPRARAHDWPRDAACAAREAVRCLPARRAGVSQQVPRRVVERSEDCDELWPPVRRPLAVPHSDCVSQERPVCRPLVCARLPVCCALRRRLLPVCHHLAEERQGRALEVARVCELLQAADDAERRAVWHADGEQEPDRLPAARGGTSLARLPHCAQGERAEDRDDANPHRHAEDEEQRLLVADV
ncbi:hypothetical protein M9Y10_039947 [Tritrichomonas musculus]|uniref:Uncharacterized protein n=1 Tax=Tritrichomonas musculus TaxID=1915356 RepID=A0ABR2GQC2_9EUKA